MRRVLRVPAVPYFKNGVASWLIWNDTQRRIVDFQLLWRPAELRAYLVGLRIGVESKNLVELQNVSMFDGAAIRALCSEHALRAPEGDAVALEFGFYPAVPQGGSALFEAKYGE